DELGPQGDGRGRGTCGERIEVRAPAGCLALLLDDVDENDLLVATLPGECARHFDGTHASGREVGTADDRHRGELTRGRRTGAPALATDRAVHPRARQNGFPCPGAGYRERRAETG